MQGNGDFTSERVNMMQRVNKVRTDLELSPKEFVGLLGLIDTYSTEGDLPAGWLQCEDVLFESLARLLTREVTHTGAVDRWLGAKLCDTFLVGQPRHGSTHLIITRCVGEFASDASCPLRFFRMYHKVHMQLAPALDDPTFSVCARMLAWAQHPDSVDPENPPGAC